MIIFINFSAHANGYYNKDEAFFVTGYLKASRNFSNIIFDIYEADVFNRTSFLKSFSGQNLENVLFFNYKLIYLL